MELTRATLADKRATSARLEISGWGCPYADVVVDGEATLRGRVDLAIGDLAMKATVLAGGTSTGAKRSSFRLVAGNAGWGQTIAKKDYGTDAGVKLATVLKDAADDCGEQLDVTTVSSSARVGPKFVRPEGPACRLLELLAEGAWYVDLDGVTKIGRRPATPLTTVIPHVAPLDRALGMIALAPTSIAKLVPGVVVDGLEAVDVIHTISGKGGLRTTLYAKRGAGLSRRLAAERAKFEQLFPELRFAGTYEFRVITREGSRLNLQPVLRSTGMPDLRRVPIRPGLAGSKSDLQEGARVLVCFIHSDPGRPNVFAVEDSDGEGWKPLLTEIDAQTVIKLGAGVRPAIAAGDLAGIFPCVPTQVKVLI